MQNFKVDVIYHQSPSDFEMEFNLGSVCQMRILSDKTNDKKSFVQSLVRGVARSRVIICCGSLFGNDGLVNVVAKAIGTGTSICDNKTYGINSDDSIDILSGSTPLVTPDGYFGGCIIESGPQTIILLTENKTFRKAIMKNLIHPYMAEISYFIPGVTTEMDDEIIDELEPETAVSEGEDYITDKNDEYNPEEQSQEAEEVSEETDGMGFIMDEDESVEESEEVEEVVNDDIIDIYSTTKDEEHDVDEEMPQVTSKDDGLFISERIKDVYEQKLKQKENMRAMDITITILVLMLLLAVLALVYLLVLRPMSMGVGVVEYIKEIFGIANNSTLV